MTSPTQAASRNPRLDGLRGLAILLVVFHHGGLRLPLGEGTALHIYASAVELGFLGVDLFFVLSGFLITGILLRAKDRPHYFRTFYVRRTLRIFPVYYLWLAFVLLAIPSLPFFAKFGYFERVSPFESWWYWLYLSNLKVAVAGGWQHSLLLLTWSLAIEEQFYLVWPFVVWRFAGPALARVCLGFIGFALLLRIALISFDVTPYAVFALAPCRIDTLAVGSLIAALCTDPAGQARCLALARRILAPCALAFAAFILFCEWGLGVRPIEAPLSFDPWMQTLGYSLAAWTFGALIVVSVFGEPIWRGLLENRALRGIGRISYSLYLTHTFVGGMVMLYLFHPLEHPGWGGALLSYGIELACMIALASLIWWVVERPIEKWKSRWSAAANPTF